MNDNNSDSNNNINNLEFIFHKNIEVNIKNINYLKNSTTKLTENQKNKLENLLINEKFQDLEYFANHPEIQIIIKLMLRQLYENKPKNIFTFFAKYFQQNNINQLNEMIAKELNENNIIYEKPFEFDCHCKERKTK